MLLYCAAAIYDDAICVLRAFDSDAAKKLNIEIFEAIYYGALVGSSLDCRVILYNM